MNKLDLSNTKQRTLPQLIRRQAKENTDQTYLIQDETKLSFAEVDQLSDAAANDLKQRGVVSQDNVALLLSNSSEMVIYALAINKLDAIWVPINTDYHGAWLINTIQESLPKLVISEPDLIESNQAAFAEMENLDLLTLDDDHLDQLAKSPQAETPQSTSNFGDTSAILWTSGTTGKSKGVLVSHNNWIRPIVDGTSLFYNSEPGDCIFNVLPMYHAAAWNTAILRALVEGISVVIEKKFSASNFLERINHFGATQSFTLGAMHMFLWQSASNREKDSANTLKKLQAVPMPAQIKTEFENRFGVTVLGSGFGQSECMMVITEAGFDQVAPENSLGFAARDLEVGLFNEQHQQVDVGDIGEIRVKPSAPHVICNGYFNDPDASAATWHGEWFCTGDLARQHESGAYFFVDRKKDAVRFAGRNISTLEVESVVRPHPDVTDVAAYGIPNPELESEDELALAVVTNQDAELIEADLAKFINENAPHYFVPRYIRFVTRLPYTPTNKVQKYKLREQAITDNTWVRTEENFVVQR